MRSSIQNDNLDNATIARLETQDEDGKPYSPPHTQTVCTYFLTAVEKH
jgi:hypothetical protein